MSYQDNLPWAQLQQLQNAAQYSQQIPGFVNTQNPTQIHPNLIAQTTSQHVPQNVYNTLPLQQQQQYSQGLIEELQKHYVGGPWRMYQDR